MSVDNVCCKCGQKRILIKTWQEDVVTANGTSQLTYSQFSCPDRNCQSQIDGELEKKRLESIERERMSEEREQTRIKSRAEGVKNSRKKTA